MKRFPDTLVIVFFVLIGFWALTWMVPPGEFERTMHENREIVVPGTFEYYVPEDPDEFSRPGLMSFLTSFNRGFVSAADIIGFVLLIGGAFGIIHHTGAITAGLHEILLFSKKHPKYRHVIIPLVMVLFSAAGATFGMAEEVLVFIMITIPLAIALGYDSLVGISIPFIGAGAGFAGAVINPFTVQIAQGIADIPLVSGWEYRLVVWFVMTTIAISFVMIYAFRLEKDPTRSPVYEIDKKRDTSEFHAEHAPKLNTSRILIILSLVGAIVLLVIGAVQWGWYINELSGLFLALGIVVAIIFRMPMNTAAIAFGQGVKDMAVAALIIGIARAMLVIASDGMIVDTILFAISNATEGLPAGVSVQVMFIFQSSLNFFVPSGSGQAALTMPLMAPLSDLVGIGRQTAVLAYQLGDGITNLIVPTSGVMMGILAIAKVPYNVWFKWVGVLVLIMAVAAMLLLLPPVLFMEYANY